MRNVYVDLTREFNEGRLRAVMSSGQAVVMHRLAVMSKDGDWILREDEEALAKVLDVLAARGATYRFGAPLDVRWMKGGWSAHFEYRGGAMRIRTDFVTRPPRLDPRDLAAMWAELDAAVPDVPVLDPRRLIALKRTNREKDYAVIGELARLLTDPREQIRASRSPRDLLALRAHEPAAFQAETASRPALVAAEQGEDALAEALDRERRSQIKENERRLRAYLDAGRRWAGEWRELSGELVGRPLLEAHRLVVERARGVLPATVEWDPNERGPFGASA